MCTKKYGSLGMALLDYCELWQPFRSPRWSLSDLSFALDCPVEVVESVLMNELETDFVTLSAVFRLSYLDQMPPETRLDFAKRLQMAGFHSLEDYEISRKMLVFSKGFF